ncbi:MAG: hypothetical protein MUO63_04305 [Desulfobulbaceae bacterium]|nr:hypothetical protein [Desulfobulbaceae bacterium]
MRCLDRKRGCCGSFAAPGSRGDEMHRRLIRHDAQHGGENQAGRLFFL